MFRAVISPTCPSVGGPQAGRSLAALGIIVCSLTAALLAAQIRPQPHEPTVRELERIAQRNPTAPLLLTLTRRYTTTGEHSLAMETARRFVRLYPSDATAHNTLGIVLAERGEIDAARKAFSQAMTLNTRYLDPYLNLGRIAMFTGDKKKALAEYDRATAVDSASPRAWKGYADAAASLGYTLQAKDGYERAIQLDPKNPGAYAALGVHLADIGRGMEARPYLEKAFAMGDRSPPLLASLALALADQPRDPSDLTRALEFAETAVANGATGSMAPYAWGLALQRSGRYQEAVRRFKQTLEINEGANGAWIGLSQCYRALGQHEIADKAAERATLVLTQRQRAGNLVRQIRFHPDRLDLRQEYAELLMQKGDYLAAADQFRYIAQHGKGEAGDWLKAARAFELGGKPDLAKYLQSYANQRPGR